MFVYVLIVAELAVLYTVFWYLYVRKPECKKNISSDLWGSYDTAMHNEPAMLYAPISDHANADAYFMRARDEFQVAMASEFKLDQKTNRIVAIDHQGASLLEKMAAKIDKTLSQLNVKP